MSEDYARGFKDGFAAGLEEGKKLAPVRSNFPGYLGSATTCSVCGKDFGNKIWGYVCNNANCPTRAIAYSGGAVTGAVGSTPSYDNMSVGANGPANKFPSYEEEKERLARYNQVWINGQWAELGS